MSAPHALILTAPGTNRDRDAADALGLAGASTTRVSLHALKDSVSALRSSQLVVLAGGFSHGDALGAGAVWASDVSTHLADELRAFVADGKAVIGICNGFQTLVRTGLLPGSLAHNAQGSFVCKWVTIEPTENHCIWTDGIHQPVYCPVAHGEGRYIADDQTIARHGALRYIDGTNPNGSWSDVAGATDATGRILGLMPHPENHIFPAQNPRHHRTSKHQTPVEQSQHLGLALFAAGVRHARRI
jgi:phosphoribosylformylglycinamidine synthase subunit PurQ / glutaminase